MTQGLSDAQIFCDHELITSRAAAQPHRLADLDMNHFLLMLLKLTFKLVSMMSRGDIWES